MFSIFSKLYSQINTKFLFILSSCNVVQSKHRSSRPSCCTVLIKKLNELISTLIRKIFKIVNVCHMTVRNILKNNLKLKPYKINYYHVLSEEDYAHHVHTCGELLKIPNADVNIIRNLITFDETTFYVKDYVNRHNCRIWRSEPPDGVCIKSQSSPKADVWGAVTCYGLIGPYFFEDVMKAGHYLRC